MRKFLTTSHSVFGLEHVVEEDNATTSLCELVGLGVGFCESAVKLLCNCIRRSLSFMLHFSAADSISVTCFRAHMAMTSAERPALNLEQGEASCLGEFSHGARRCQSHAIISVSFCALACFARLP